jgi:hypothetical protein
MEDANYTSPVTPERIRELLLRNGLESNRLREAVAWAVRITPMEANVDLTRFGGHVGAGLYAAFSLIISDVGASRAAARLVPPSMSVLFS